MDEAAAAYAMFAGKFSLFMVAICLLLMLFGLLNLWLAARVASIVVRINERICNIERHVFGIVLKDKE